MSDIRYDVQSRSDFNKARNREFFSKLFNAFTPERYQLLSLGEVRDLVKPRTEVYKGLKTIDISNIIGSEGRYHDFNKAFLPRHDYTRGRWQNINKAHLKDEVLPPIQLYKISEVYFVRDGNHRVSVFRSQGVQSVDAEVIELTSEIHIDPGMTSNDLKNAVIAYEKKQFFEKKHMERVIDPRDLEFTAVGQYKEVLNHIEVHKYYLNEKKEDEIPLLKAAKSWYRTLFLPIVKLIKKDALLSRFPGRTYADLYVWIIKHWGFLKEKFGPDLSLEEAVKDYSLRFGKGFWERFGDFIISLIKRLVRYFRS